MLSFGNTYIPTHSLFTHKNLFFFFFFYKNNHYQAKISHNFKKMLRTYAGWESVKRVFNSLILLFGKPNSARVSNSWFVRHLVHGIKASRTTRWQATWYHMTANNAFLEYVKDVFRLNSQKRYKARLAPPHY